MKSGPKSKLVTCHPGAKHCAHGLCRPCYHRSNVPAREYKREGQLKFKYGITTAQWDRMWLKQGGKCAICLRPPKQKRLAVDHDHKTNRVRGLLCWWCNNRIVTSRITPEDLRRAANYLESEFDGRQI